MANEPNETTTTQTVPATAADNLDFIMGEDTITPEEQAQLDALHSGETPDVGAPEVPVEGIETEAEAAPEAEVETELEVKPKRQPRVPLPELQKERERRQELEARIRELEQDRLQERERLARGEERLRMLQELAEQQRQPAPQDVEPDKDIDPVEWYEWKFAQLEKRDQAREAQINQTAQQTAGIAAVNRISQMEAEFARQTPDYPQVVQRLGQHLDQMFTPMFPDVNARRQAISYWTAQTIQQAAALGRNPAELTYEIARSVGLVSAPQPSGDVSAPKPDRLPLHVVKKAQQASRTLSNISGTSPKGPPTVDEIYDMTEEEYEHYKNGLERKYGRPVNVPRLIGGL